jgi:hypothetical protein
MSSQKAQNGTQKAQKTARRCLEEGPFHVFPAKFFVPFVGETLCFFVALLCG